MTTYDAPHSVPELRPRDIERFWRQVDVTPSCWLWNASRSTCGYGLFSAKKPDGRWAKFRAHRVAMGLANPDFQPDLDVDHRFVRFGCPRHCVNPEHLRQVTRAQNMQNRPPQANNTSGVPGVRWYKRDSRWQAGVKVNGRNHHLGYFTDKADAEEAVSRARRSLHPFSDPSHQESA